MLERIMDALHVGDDLTSAATEEDEEAAEVDSDH